MQVIQAIAFILSICFINGQLEFPGFSQTPPNGACKTRNNQPGTCIPRVKCPRNTLNSFSQQFCGFHNRQIHICCQKSATITKPNEVSSPKISFECGKRGAIKISFGFPSFFSGPSLNLRNPSLTSTIVKRAAIPDKLKIPDNFPNPEFEKSVVGGIESSRNSWPWMALLGRKFGPRNVFFCSGVVINEQYVLTAAHCVLDLAPFFVRLGEHDHSIDGASNLRAAEDISVDDVVFHPDYDIDQGYYDMAILKLGRKVSFRNEIKPVCLPWGRKGNEDLVNERVTVTGWGTEEFGGPSSNVLREVQINVFEPSVCHKSYSTLKDFSRDFPKGMNKQNIVCAGDEFGGKDACQGDSGGPMVHEGSRNTYFLAGIISKGYGCGKKGFPGLYAPLRHYDTLQWIKRTAF